MKEESHYTPEMFRIRLRSGAKRLAQLVEFGAPTNIIATEVALLLRYALALCGEDLGKAVGSILLAPVRNWYGLCEQCLKPLTEWGQRQCIACNLKDEIELGDTEDDH